MPSLMVKCLNSAMSKLVRPGLRRLFLPAVPNVRPVGVANAPGLYFSGGVAEGTPELGFPTTSGYEPAPTLFPTPSVSPKGLALVMVSGVRVDLPAVPDYCHPPRALWAMRGSLKKGRA